MKILVGSFNAESNMFTPENEKLDDFILFYGNEMLDYMHSKDLFETAGIDIIPTIYANGSARGYIEKKAFDHICDTIMEGVKKHKKELDGIFLFLHGASHVIDLYGDSGEHHILEKIREEVGYDMPIAVTMDPHGNVTKRFTELANIIRCYRESPHTDIVETHRITAKLFIELLKNKRRIQPQYARVSILIGGERCVSFESPLLDINKKLDECEKREGIMSASYHVGFAWADSPACCAAVVVVPTEEKYQRLAGLTAKEIADYAFSRREDFHFTGNALDPMEAIEEAFMTDKRPVIVSDAGDNCTAGALGYNTIFLKHILAKKEYSGKKILFAAIRDAEAYKYLEKNKNDDFVTFSLGVNIDNNSIPVEISGTIKARGIITQRGNLSQKTGNAITVSVNNGALDIIIIDCYNAYTELHQFSAANINWKNYDIIVVKMGYIFPELKEIAGHTIMALTPGATDQHTENIPYKLIFRPMYPVDKIFY